MERSKTKVESVFYKNNRLSNAHVVIYHVVIYRVVIYHVVI